MLKAFLNESSSNLPQRIALVAELNSANQGDLTSPPTDKNSPYQITSAKQAAEYAGWGSPVHTIAENWFPEGGGLIGGIPVYVYGLDEPDGAAAQEQVITVTGTATKNCTHTLKIAGRKSIRTGSYDVNILKDDTDDDIAEKIYNVINNVLGCPVTAAMNSPMDNEVTTTSKWKGLTAQDITITVDTNGNAAGITYAIEVTEDGAGTPSVTGAQALMGPVWNTLVLNGLNDDEDTLDAWEQWNGIADPELPTGRYTGNIFRPCIVFSGSLKDNPSTVTDGRKDEMTNCIAPAPLSPGLPFEAAANLIAIVARTAQDTPHLNYGGKSYRDMPVATEAIAMSDYNNRDAYVKKGSSTVDIVNDKYQLQDVVVTNHPDGEVPAIFQYVRDLLIDFNIYYGYNILVLQYVWDHLIANDNDVVKVAKVIKPKEWRRILGKYFDDLAERGLIADPAFSKASLEVRISTTNPKRLEVKYRYKRTGTAEIVSTSAAAGFNFGSTE